MSSSEINKSKQIAPILDKLKKVNQVWNDYMSDKRDQQSLVSLLKDKEIHPLFQARAMESLSAPKISNLPFKVNVDTDFYQDSFLSSNTRHWVQETTTEQALFLVRKIPLYIKEVEKKKLFDFLKSDSNNNDKLINYNDLIPILLRKLSIEDEGTDKLFDSFKINDLVSFNNFENASGYRPLKRLMTDKLVDEHWKLKAANKIHEIISKEENGKIKPREDWERAISCYCEILDFLAWQMTNEGGLPISNSFYEKEIAFVLDFKKVPIVDKRRTNVVLNILQNREIWYKFAKKQILPNEHEGYEGFTIESDEDVEFAQRAITDFYDDQDIKSFFSKQFREYEIMRNNKSKFQQENIEKKERIISAMKRVNLD